MLTPPEGGVGCHLVTWEQEQRDLQKRRGRGRAGLFCGGTPRAPPRASHPASCVLHPIERVSRCWGRPVPQEAPCGVCPWAGPGCLPPSGGGGQERQADVTCSFCEVVELDGRVLRLLGQILMEF